MQTGVKARRERTQVLTTSEKEEFKRKFDMFFPTLSRFLSRATTN